MSVITKDLGNATAYGYAVSKGYTGTEAEFAELMASYATVAEEAETAKDMAEEWATGGSSGTPGATNNAKYYSEQAAGSALTASSKAGEAAQSATNASGYKDTASTKAGEAASSAQSASSSAQAASESATAAAASESAAQSSAQAAFAAVDTATTKANEASASAADALDAKSAAQTAQTAAEAAQTAAETAQGAAETARTGAETAQTQTVQAAAGQIAQINATGAAVLESIPSDYTELSGDVSNLKSASDDINRRFDNPNVMDYNSIAHDTRFCQVNGEVRPQGTALHSVIFRVEPETSYYLQIVVGYNRRVIVGNSTSEFVTGSTYTFISSVADGTTGMKFTTPIGVNYVMVYFYNGDYTFNSRDFILYEGNSIPSNIEAIVKKENLPADILYSDTDVVTNLKTEIDGFIYTTVTCEYNYAYFPNVNKLQINTRYGKIYDGGILRVSDIPSGIKFGIQGYSTAAYAQKVYDPGWKTTDFEFEINKDYYYIIVFQKTTASTPFESLDDTPDVTVEQIVSIRNKIENTMPLTSFTVRSIAHRGDIMLAPQSTAPSYIIARKRGHTIGENDVWNSYDGEFVMWHDTSLSLLGNLVDISGYEMYTDGTGFYYFDADNSQLYTYDDTEQDYVESAVSISGLVRCDGSNYSVTGLNLAVLKRIDFGVYRGSQFKGTQILTFDEWILLMKKLGMEAYIDRKIGYTPEIVTELVNKVKKYGMLDHVSWIGVPTTNLIDAIRSVDSNARIGVLSHPDSTNIVTYAPYNTGRGFFFNGSAKNGMTEEAIQTGINAGFEVEVYYVGYESATEETILNTISTAISYGVTGITLDHYSALDPVQELLNKYDFA